MKQLYSQFIKPGDVVFNIGANTGNRTALFVELGASLVVAVEPQPILAGELRRRFKSLPQVAIIEAAAGPTSGTVDLRLCTDNMLATCAPGWAEALKNRWPMEKWQDSIPVTQVTLDELIGRGSLPSFIKIDVEGYEDEVLKGLTQPVKALSFEYTVPYIKPALASVDLVEELGLTRFAYIIQEGPRLEKGGWRSGQEMKQTLRKLPVSTFYGDIFAVQEANMIEEKKEEKKSKKPELPEITVNDGDVVAAPGKGIWCIDGEVRRWVPDPNTQIKMGIGMHHVIMLHPEQLEKIPEGEPMPKIR